MCFHKHQRSAWFAFVTGVAEPRAMTICIQRFMRMVTHIKMKKGQEMEGKELFFFFEVSIFTVSKIIIGAYTNLSLCKSQKRHNI